MLTHPKTLQKVRRLEDHWRALIFVPVAEVPMQHLDVGREHLRSPPAADAGWTPATDGLGWGGPWENAWFAGTAVIPADHAGHPLWLIAETGAVETLCFVDGEPRGILAREIEIEMGTRGNHLALRVTAGAAAGSELAIALECYAGHPCVGTHPYDSREFMAAPGRYRHAFQRVTLNRRRDQVADFVWDLMALNRLASSLPADDFRRGRVIGVLDQLLCAVTQDPASLDEAAWGPQLTAARALMAPALDEGNAPGGPRVGLVGHSHMDTAWMWTIDETIRKCARTFASVLTLMEQYPEYTFFQSAPYHLELIRRHYPSLHARICERAKEGRWQLEGATWIEPDCNIPSGEALVRQFLWGQRAIHAATGRYSTIYWQPDVFGYNAALPQIMARSGVTTFCTTKLGWNETNPFPHDTFTWRGIDGSEVFAHFNETHRWPHPEHLLEISNQIKHKDRHRDRLLAYGFGDGGGGPMFEMIEVGRRCVDLAGCPRSEHVNAAAFLDELRASAEHPVWQGELYLELHRGTLTSKHQIKAGNRRCEQALRDLEIIDAVLAEGDADSDQLRALWEDLLVNQFHDILPGTSLGEVHARAEAELHGAAERAEAATAVLLGDGGDGAIRVANTLGFTRGGTLELVGLPSGRAPQGEGVRTQELADIAGEVVTVVSGLELPPLATVDLPVGVQVDSGAPPFTFDGTTLDAPHLRLVFADDGAIASWFDKASGRELRVDGGLPLNTFLIGEDIPQVWDNWDIDPDQERLMTPVATPVDVCAVAADGPLQFRLRVSRAVGRSSRIVHDVIVDADSRAVRFDVQVDWRERHQLLKTSFPLAIHAERCRHEIQFGHVDRPTHVNRPTDKAQFEVCNHRWTDCSEPRFGAALLNESSYGIATCDRDLRLSLLKSGTHPDPGGDDGVHRLRYALLPHDGFGAVSVIRPAIAFNAPLRWASRTAVDAPAASFASVDRDHVVIEAIKRAEDGDGLILRLWECEGARAPSRLRLAGAWRVSACDLLERDQGPIEPAADGAYPLALGPFEIVSLRLRPT